MSGAALPMLLSEATSWENRLTANRWASASLTGIVLAGGSEAFFRYATYGSLKAVAVGLVFAGITLLGWSGLGREELPHKLIVALAFTVYVVQAAWRFPGVLKDDITFSALSILALKGLLTLTVLTMVTAGVARGFRAAASSFQNEYER